MAMKEIKPATEICHKCHGTGWYTYTTYGTPHQKPCEVCCKHDKGFWLLKEHYGEDNNKWCCMAGCGLTKLPEHTPECERRHPPFH